VLTSTHDVTNQSSALVGYNLYAGNRAMRDALRFHLPNGDEAARIAFGAELGTLVATAKLKFRESVAQGLENAPEAFLGLLKGRNFGKQLVKLV
jgi:NADPH-dependent curcumin reductase CurA